MRGPAVVRAPGATGNPVAGKAVAPLPWTATARAASVPETAPATVGEELSVVT
jgi:hypothetical protein